MLCVTTIVAIHPEQACIVNKTCIIIIQMLVVFMYVVSKVHNRHVCGISNGVAKKTMSAEIAISSEQHKEWPATPVPMPLINMSA